MLLQILEKFVSGEVVPGGKVSFDQEREQPLTDAKASSMKPKNISSSESPVQKSDVFNAAKSSAAKGSAGGGAGIQFSDEKDEPSDQQQALGIGDGIISGQKSKSNNKAERHIDKANSLLDELSREEKSGFKAEIGSGSDNKPKDDDSPDTYQPQNNMG